jgi:hypothetical protein
MVWPAQKCVLPDVPGPGGGRCAFLGRTRIALAIMCRGDPLVRDLLLCSAESKPENNWWSHVPVGKVRFKVVRRGRCARVGTSTAIGFDVLSTPDDPSAWRWSCIDGNFDVTLRVGQRKVPPTESMKHMTQHVRYASMLSLFAVRLSSGAAGDNEKHDIELLHDRETGMLVGPERRPRMIDGPDASSSGMKFHCLRHVLPFLRYYPCREEERVRLSCRNRCSCVSSLEAGSPGACVDCQALLKMTEAQPTMLICQQDISPALAASSRNLESYSSEQRRNEDQDGEPPAGSQGGGEGDQTSAPAPVSSSSEASIAPSPYPSFISFVPSTSWYPTVSHRPTGTHRPTVTWYPSHTWRPSVTWYPSHSLKPSASPSSRNEGDEGEGDVPNEPPSAPAPFEKRPASPAASNGPTTAPSISGAESESSSSSTSGKAPSVPGKAAFGLIVVAAILVAVVYVVWSRSSSSNHRRHRRLALRNELELTETERNRKGNTLAYDYHDRTGSYDPNEII